MADGVYDPLTGKKQALPQKKVFDPVEDPYDEHSSIASSAKRTAGSIVQGLGEAGSDVGIPGSGALTSYGKSVTRANPPKINSFSDIASHPIDTATSLIGEYGTQIGAQFAGSAAGGRVGGMLGPAGRVAGSIVGGLSPIAAQMYGSNVQRQEANGQDRDPAKAAAATLAQTALEGSFGPQRIVNRIMKPSAVIRAGERRAAAAGREAVRSGAEEALTEPAQQVIEQVQAGEDPTTGQNLYESAFSSAMGGIGGGIAGGAVGGLGPRERAPDQDQAEGGQTEGGELPSPDGGPAAPAGGQPPVAPTPVATRNFAQWAAMVDDSWLSGATRSNDPAEREAAADIRVARNDNLSPAAREQAAERAASYVKARGGMGVNVQPPELNEGPLQSSLRRAGMQDEGQAGQRRGSEAGQRQRRAAAQKTAEADNFTPPEPEQVDATTVRSDTRPADNEGASREVRQDAGRENPQRNAPQGRGQGDEQAAQGQEAQDVNPRTRVADLDIYEQPLADITNSKDVPQFKADADAETGVVEPLQGQFDRRGTGPIQVWERNDGRREVISGRHRTDLARRSGETTIPAQLHRESEGFTPEHAASLDAELNIRDEQGSVNDYAQYFKGAGIDRETAESRGLLARAKGRSGFAIAENASEPLFAAHSAGQVGDEAARQIADAAPKNERLQAVGMGAISRGESIANAVNTMRAVSAISEERGDSSGDMFGFDDSGMRQAQEMAKIASAKQRKIRERISAVRGAAKRPKQARELGVNVKDPEAVNAAIRNLQREASRWQNWNTDPALIAEIRSEMTGEVGAAGSGRQDEAAETSTGDMAQQGRDEQSRLDALNKRADGIDNERARTAQTAFENGSINADAFERILDEAEGSGQGDVFNTGQTDRTQTLDAADRPENFALAGQQRTDEQAAAESEARAAADQNDMFGGQTQAGQERAATDRQQREQGAPAAAGGLFESTQAPEPRPATGNDAIQAEADRVADQANRTEFPSVNSVTDALDYARERAAELGVSHMAFMRTPEGRALSARERSIRAGGTQTPRSRTMETSQTEGATNERTGNGGNGKEPLAASPAEQVRAPESQQDAERGSDGGGQPDTSGNGRAQARGRQRNAGVGRGQGSVRSGGSEQGRGESRASVTETGSPEPEADADAMTMPGRARTPSLSGENPGNYRITDADNIGSGTRGQRIDNNIAAIETVKRLESEGRYATPDEQATLAKFVGWGGLKRVFQIDSKSTAQDRRANARLRELLTDEEYDAARRSVLDSHYTSPDVVRGLYAAVEHMGFEGGRILEPSVGAGNFIGLMTESLTASRVDAVELDSISAAIAKHLYPESQIINRGFEKSNLPYAAYDLVIGNPPFGDRPITDNRRKEISGFTIHNYFVAKSAMHLRPGGVMAMVITNRFLDKPFSKERKYLQDHLQFLGAIRLPNRAFAENAGTEVTTDLVFFRKPAAAEDLQQSPAWSNVEEFENEDGENVRANEYFVNNPDLMLGKPTMGGTMYGPGEEFTLESRPNQNLRRDIEAALQRPEFTRLQGKAERTDQASEVQAVQYEPNLEDMNIGGFALVDGDIMRRLDDDADGNPVYEKLTPDTQWTPKTKLGDKRLARIRGMLEVRQAAYTLMAAERADMPNIEALRNDLNKRYDAFVAKHGYINDNANASLFADDIRIEFGLEADYKPAISKQKAKALGVQPAKATARKSSLLTRRVNYPRRNIESAATPRDGYIVNLTERGVLDLPFIAQITGKSYNEVVDDLSSGDKPLIYKDPVTDQWVQEDEYLSGNVKAKLAEAQDRPGFEKNVEALKRVIPDDVPANQIKANFGATWIPSEIYEDFAEAIGVENPRVWVAKSTGMVTISGKPQRGGDYIDFYSTGLDQTAVFNRLASNKPLVVRYKASDGKTYVNQEATDGLRQAANAIKTFFDDWIMADSLRADQLADVFNETMNTTIPRQYDGSLLQLTGANPEIVLRDTQARGAWRMVQSDRTLLDHVVGAGKAQPLDAKLLTPSGWVRMGDIAPGDQVITRSGRPTEVEAVFPQGEKDIYRVTFSDGSETECCDEHLWLTQTYRERGYAQRAARSGKDWACGKPKVRALSDIRDTLAAPHLAAKNHSIPMVEPVAFEPQPVPLDPYLMGVLLGDGHIGRKAISVSSSDPEIFAALILPEGARGRLNKAEGKCPSLHLVGTQAGRNPVLDACRDLGLTGLCAHEKSVPEIYKINDRATRLAVLQGLMDTDGWVQGRGLHTCFSTASDRLAEDVVFLVQSLGGTVKRSLKPTSYTAGGVKHAGRPAHTLTLTLPPEINPFRLARKVDAVVPKTRYKPARYIVAVEPVGRKEAQCIRVADPSHLYVTDDFIVTHNTFTVIAGIMERRRMGLSRKPLLVVPNHKVGDWARDFMLMYPGARILAASKKDFAKSNRRRLFARIATGEYDAVIVGHSSFGFIPLLPENEAAFIRDQIRILETAIEETGADDPGAKRTVRQMENSKAKLEQRIEKLMDEPRDPVATMEEMGIDSLSVDESHEFKNLMISTSLTNIGGMGNLQGSKKALGMFMKMRHLQKQGGTTYLATGTPITNTLAEMYTVLRYMNYEALQERGLESFDAWARAHASIEDRVELSAGGNFRSRSVMARFQNLPELMQMYNQFADVLTMADLKRQYAKQIERTNAETGANERTEFPVPKVANGGRQLVVSKPSPLQEEYSEFLRMRADALQQPGNDIDPSEDNMLLVTTDSRKMSMDIRLVDPDGGDFADSKINKATANIKRIYDKWHADRGTQLVFSDLGTPVKYAKSNARKTLKSMIDRLPAEDQQRARAATERMSYADAGEYIEYRMSELVRNAGELDAKLESLSKYLDEEVGEDLAVLNTAHAGFSVYDELKSKLVDAGIPANEIAFVHDYNTDKQKNDLYDAVNSGQIRVLLGSTPKMGAGTNVQERVVGEHHMDAPWRPADVEQREGRVIRQGNVLYERDPDGFEVEIYAYSTERTLDSMMWQTLARKQEMLGQFRNASAREVEDIYDEGAGYSDFMAQSTGNPVFKEQAQLKIEAAQLRSRKNQVQSRLRGAKHNIDVLPDRIKSRRENAEKLDRAATAFKNADSSAITHDGKTVAGDYDAKAKPIIDEWRKKMDAFAEAQVEYSEQMTQWENGDLAEKPTSPVRPPRPSIATVAKASKEAKFYVDMAAAIEGAYRENKRFKSTYNVAGVDIQIEYTPPIIKNERSSGIEGELAISYNGSVTEDVANLSRLADRLMDRSRPESAATHAEGQAAGARRMADRYEAALSESKDMVERLSFDDQARLEEVEERLSKATEEIERIEQEMREKARARGNRYTSRKSYLKASFSVGEESAPAANRLNTGSLRAALRRMFGDGVSRMEQNGTLHIVATDNELPADLRGRGAKGVVIQGEGANPRVYLVADQLEEGTVKGVFLHEVGVHYGMRDMLGEDAFNEALQRMGELYRVGNKAVRDAYNRVPDWVSASKRDEEALGYLVENAKTIPMVRSIIARLKAFLFRTFGIGGDRLNDADMVMLAQSSAARATNRDPAGATQAQADFSNNEAPTTKPVGQFYDANGNRVDVEVNKSGAVRLHPITRDEADLFGPGMRVIRFATLGPDTTGYQGWFIDPSAPAAYENDAQREVVTRASQRETVEFYTRFSNEGKKRVFYRVGAAGSQVTPRGPQGEALFSVAGSDALSGQPGEEYNAAKAEAMARGGLRWSNMSRAERIVDTMKSDWERFKENVIARWREGFFDKFAPIKDLAGNVAYMSARLSSGSSSTTYAALLYGAPQWKDGVVQKRDGSKGLLDILDPVHEDMNEWLGWMVGKRAAYLKAQGRERNLTDEHIAELTNDVSGEKLERFERVAREVREFNTDLLKLAQGAGLLSADQVAAFSKDEYYTPFYRVEDEDAMDMPAQAYLRRELSHQTAGIHRLKGGSQALSDPLENMIANMQRLIDASLKNKAMADAVYGASDLLTPAKEGDRGDRDVVRVMRDGKAEYFRVENAPLLRSLVGINNQPMPGLKPFRSFKRVLTLGVTADPAFMMRNFARDMMQAWLVDKNGFKFGVDSIQGAKDTLKSIRDRHNADIGMQTIMFAGSSFIGGHAYGDDPRSQAAALRRALHAHGIHRNDADSFMDSIIDTGERWWSAYRQLGDAAENANRMAVLRSALKAGRSTQEAVFEAKDLMDFSLQGNFLAMRVLSDMLPFFNARMQGLYKLGRALREDPRTLAKRGAMVALASTALVMANSGNPDYDDLPEWDKDLFWHIFLPGGGHLRIPKPFELGILFGTVPERMYRKAGGYDTWRESRSSLILNATQVLALDPTPQMIDPMVEVYMNYDKFRGRPIENMGDQQKMPGARYSAFTSPTMVEIGKRLNVSPKKLEHVWEGYLGTLGSYVLGVSDLAVRWARGDVMPSRTVNDMPLLSSFYRDSTQPMRSTKYANEFYDMLNEANSLASTIKQYRESGDTGRARELMTDNADLLRNRKMLSAAQRQAGTIRDQIEQVRANTSLTPAQKRERINRMQTMLNQIMKQATEKAR